MPKLSSSVGKSAPNRPHDVALIQAALANLPASTNSPFGQKIWTKQVDGRSSLDLERAITLFQSNNRITQSGRIDPMGPDIQALDRTLPPDRKGIAAVENCTAVLCSSMNVSAMNQAQEALRKKTLLPGPAAEQLGDVVRDIHKQMGLVLRPDGHGIDQQGRMVQKLAFADTHWMNQSGQFTPQIPLDKAQQVVSALLRRPLPSLLEWHTGPMPFGHASVHQSQRVGNMIGASGGGMGNVVLAIRIRQGLRCLSGMNRPVDNQRLQRLGLRLTGDPVADRMQDVAAGEIEAGNAGANELGIIGDIFKGLFDGASNIIRTASSGERTGGGMVFVNPTGGAIRGSDKKGKGHFRAPRTNTAGFHKGTDYISTPGQNVRAVISGRVSKHGWPYGDRPSIRLIDIENSSGYRVRHFYVSLKPGLSVGDTISAGDVIGTAQSLTVFSEFEGMTEHVHVEIYHNGQLVDPANLIR